MKIFALAVVTLLRAPSSSAAVVTVPEGSSTTISCTNGGVCCYPDGTNWGSVSNVSGGTIVFGRSVGCTGVSANGQLLTVSASGGTKLQNCGTSGGCILACSDDCTAPITGQGAPATGTAATAPVTTTTTTTTTSATAAATSSATVIVPEGSTGTVSCANGGQCSLSPDSSWGKVMTGGGTVTLGSTISVGDGSTVQNCMTSGGCGLDCSADCTVLIDGQGASASSTSTETAATSSAAPATTTSSTTTSTSTETAVTTATAATAPPTPTPSTEAPSGGNMAVVTLPVIGIAVAMLNQFI